jgi:hypothetical protein|tara:strand:+ start:370 stop:546 length:177 start_codon:yes stop_codon:yes gene_type:complete
MAKYTRFDPRNKKKGRNKNISLGNTPKIKFSEKEYDDIMIKVNEKDETIYTRKDRSRV